MSVSVIVTFPNAVIYWHVTCCKACSFWGVDRFWSIHGLPEGVTPLHQEMATFTRPIKHRMLFKLVFIISKISRPSFDNITALFENSEIFHKARNWRDSTSIVGSGWGKSLDACLAVQAVWMLGIKHEALLCKKGELLEWTLNGRTLCKLWIPT